MVPKNLKNAKNYFIVAKIYKVTESVVPKKLCFNIKLDMCGLPTNMKSSSRKT